MLCDFHREKAWEEWARKLAHGVQNPVELLKLLRQIAHSRTKTEYDRSLKNLEKSDDWIKNCQLRNWFDTTWLPEKEVKLCFFTHYHGNLF